jgi:flagellar hook-associated protein 1 FlgK
VSGFSSLNVARTALWASQRGLDVTGQNIANVNTEGYSRQRAELQAIGANTVPALYSVSNEVGGGVSADTVTRIRDAFLEGRAQTEHANQANLTAAKDALSQIEQAFREPGDTGIQSMLTDVSSAWDDVANHPENLAARSQLLQRAETLVSGLHATKASLDGQWNQTRENLQVLVADVNAAAGSIAKLNEQIKQATITGEPANDLADKRDLLVMTLAEKVGATTTPGEDGAVNVVVAGTTLVAGGKALTLGLSGTSDPDAVTSDPPSIVTVPAGSKLRVGGTAQGQLATLTTIVPDYRTALDGIAQKLAGSLNAVHVTGYDLTGAPGNPMFDDHRLEHPPPDQAARGGGSRQALADRHRGSPLAGRRHRRPDLRDAAGPGRHRGEVPRARRPTRRAVGGRDAQPRHPVGHRHTGGCLPRLRRRREHRRGDDQHAAVPARVLRGRSPGHRDRRDAGHPHQPHRTSGQVT